jgi:hypothetical protein
MERPSVNYALLRRPVVLMAVWLVCATVWSATAPCSANEDANVDFVAQLLDEVPVEFPHFEFAEHEEQSKLLTHFLWYHLSHRGGLGHRMFNKEYLLTSDIWLGNATARRSGEPLQEAFRRLLLDVRIDPEGYVCSHQHFALANDWGWPFPSWAHANNNADLIKGTTYGWHFQPLKAVRGWVGGQFLRRWKKEEYVGESAISKWQLDNVKSYGIVNNCWHLETDGTSPTIVTPVGYSIDAYNAPYLQLRWKRSEKANRVEVPYVEWMREEDRDFDSSRRVYFYPEKTHMSREFDHSIMTMFRHPKWTGTIKQIRICLAPGESDVAFNIDSFFTVYDTRHTINNPILILASCRYFNWTGDLDFLRRQINRLRLALRYQQENMGGVEFRRIRNRWPGHDGLPAWHRNDKDEITFHPGHGIGSNYWDILPFGWDDCYATNQYYAATLAMADLEEAITRHPGWNIPQGASQFDPQVLRAHAADVKKTANDLFWDDARGRFVACIDKHGQPHDYGYTFLNLDSIWYGLATAAHGRSIMDWISGRRAVVGDLSTGDDIYRWRFGPRATTRRNLEWYCQGWYDPGSLPWGGQIQDGGAVLGFTFYDLWARLQLLGPDDAWQRLTEILAWEKEVRAGGGYRKYYADGKQGTTLQGGGTCGGLGIDHEFYESSLLPAIVPYGFVGLEARSDGCLAINPRLPTACPEMSISNVLYHNVRIDINVTNTAIELHCKDAPIEPLRVVLPEGWLREGGDRAETEELLPAATNYRFQKQD